ITLAGVMTLPLFLTDNVEFPARDLAIFLAAGVIILSLTAASLLLPKLLQGLPAAPESSEAAAEERARVAAAEAAIRAIEDALHGMAQGHTDADLYADAASRVMDLYRRRIEGHIRSSEDAVRIRHAD